MKHRLKTPGRALVISLIALIVALGAVPYGAAQAPARSGTWHTNTFHVTQAGVFHAYFLMPKWFQLDGFSLWIDGPKHARRCTLRYRTRTDLARRIDLPLVDFVWPEKGLRSAVRATLTCDVTGGRVTAATVFLPLGIRASRIPLRRR